MYISAKKERIILYSVDKNYMWGFLVSLFSAKLSASSEDFKCVLAYNPNDLSIEDISSIKWVAELLCIRIDFKILNHPDQFPTVNHVNNAAYNKFAVIEQMYSNFIWLDSDTLLIEGWDEIFDHIEDDNPSIAIKAVYEPTNNSNSESTNAARVVAGKDYFNSGVMIIYPSVWRNFQFDLKWTSVARERLTLGFEFNDQDVFNYMTVGHTASLPLEYNYFAKNLGIHEQFRTCRKKIIHFIGPQKPWHFSELEQFFYRRLSDFSKEFTMKVPEMERFDIQSHSIYWFIESQLLEILRSEKSNYASLILSTRKSADLNVLNWKARFKAKLLIITFKTLLINRNF